MFAVYREFRAGMDAWREIWEGSRSTSFRDDAIAHYRRAIELDPTFLGAHCAAFEAFYSGIADYAAADSCVQTMLRNRSRLNPAERLMVDYCITRLQGDHRGHLRAVRAGVELDPHFQFGLQQTGITATYLFRWREAIEAFDRMDPATMRDRLLGEARLMHQPTAHHMLGEDEEALATAELFREIYPDSPHLVPVYIKALVGLGRIEDVHLAIDQCETLAGSPFWPGYMMGNAVSELRWHDYAADADTMANRAVAYYLDRPEHEAERLWCRWGLAKSMYLAGRWDEAQHLTEELAAVLPDDIDIQGLLGVIAARRGERETAMRIIDGLRNVDQPHTEGNHIEWCARIAALLGDRERAVELLREAIGEGHILLLHTIVEYETLRGYPPFEELVYPEG
jgi:tetratricopeptide (TPR) repeat protein